MALPAAIHQTPLDLASLGGAFVRDPYPCYAELRERGPAHQIRLGEGNLGWLIVGHDAVRAALGDPRLAKNWRTLTERFDDTPRPPITTHMLESDPPQHTRLRKLVAKEFTPRRVAALEPRVQAIADELLDRMLDGSAATGGRADLVAALSFPLPITVICELLGVPFMDRASFGELSNAVLLKQPPDEERRATVAMAGYLTELVATKRERPGDDLLSALIRTQDEDGDQLSPDELLAMAFLLLVAGHETTVNLISNAVLALLRHPDQLSLLRADPGLLTGAIEETLRYDSPVERATLRIAREPVDIGGVVIPTGAIVLVAIASAGRDPVRYPDPDRFDIRRVPQPPLSFGHGIHFCIGAPLARLEARVALRTLLRRCPRLALDATERELRWRVSLIVRGPQRLPVRWPADEGVR